MTEGDRAFYKRRIREELRKVNAVADPQLKQLHLRWALLYEERLDGKPRTVTRTLEARLRDGGLSAEPSAAADDAAIEIKLSAA